MPPKKRLKIRLKKIRIKKRKPSGKKPKKRPRGGRRFVKSK